MVDWRVSVRYETKCIATIRRMSGKEQVHDNTKCDKRNDAYWQSSHVL